MTTFLHRLQRFITDLTDFIYISFIRCNRSNQRGLRQRNEVGQMMVEAMIAITIAVVGLLGIFSLLSRSLSLNRVVADQVIAANLASEGIELVKNLIDSNVIQQKPWNLGINNGSYEMDFNDSGLSMNQNKFLNFNSAGGEYGYDLGQPTRFKRKINIEQPIADEIKVNSLVNWETRGGGNFEINLEDHFFNWR